MFLVLEYFTDVNASRGSPSGWRSSVCRLGQLNGGRGLSVRYRLAPQNPFPAALLDLFTSYLSLLYPTSSSFHDVVPASKVVLVGDSCGASLCFALVQVILELHRQYSPNFTVRFHGTDVSIPLMAGLASFSAWGEATHILPSWTLNQQYDFFSHLPPIPRLPHCEIWPTTPPRGNVYCDISAIYHPLISPTLAESWVDAPPMWFCCGEEMLVDDSKIIAQRAVQ